MLRKCVEEGETVTPWESLSLYGRRHLVAEGHCRSTCSRKEEAVDRDVRIRNGGCTQDSREEEDRIPPNGDMAVGEDTDKVAEEEPRLRGDNCEAKARHNAAPNDRENAHGADEDKEEPTSFVLRYNNDQLNANC